MDQFTQSRWIPALCGTPREIEGVEIDVTEAIRQLQEYGFVPAYVKDLKVGDIWVKEPERFPYHDYTTMIHVVDRINQVDDSHFDPEDDRLVINTVVSMICMSEDGWFRHLKYGSTHGVYIYKGERQ